MSKRLVGKYPLAFRKMAVERMGSCEQVKELAKELKVSRTVLYRWRDQLAPQQRSEREREPESELTRLQRENRQLKEALADKVLEVDFFKGALQKIGARRQPNGGAGETASTTKSGSR